MVYLKENYGFLNIILVSFFEAIMYIILIIINIDETILYVVNTIKNRDTILQTIFIL